MRNEHELLVDAIERLTRAGLAYMVTGSMASNFWGIPRSTHDLDVVVTLEPSEASTIIDAFAEGFFLQPESVRSAFVYPYQFNAIDEQSALKIDFWILSDNAFDRNMFARRVMANMPGSPAWIATPEDLILHKLHWHSLNPSDRQLQDAAGLFRVQRPALDIAYLRHWATTLGVSHELEEIFAGRITPKST